MWFGSGITSLSGIRNTIFCILTGIIRDLVEPCVRMLSEWKSCDVEELYVQPDHIYPLFSIPPRVSASELIGTLKGKLAIKAVQELFSVEQKPY